MRCRLAARSDTGDRPLQAAGQLSLPRNESLSCAATAAPDERGARSRRCHLPRRLAGGRPAARGENLAGSDRTRRRSHEGGVDAGDDDPGRHCPLDRPRKLVLEHHLATYAGPTLWWTRVLRQKLSQWWRTSRCISLDIQNRVHFGIITGGAIHRCAYLDALLARERRSPGRPLQAGEVHRGGSPYRGEAEG